MRGSFSRSCTAHPNGVRVLSRYRLPLIGIGLLLIGAFAFAVGLDATSRTRIPVIDLRSDRSTEPVPLSTDDTGPGVAHEDVDRIFERFNRGRDGRRRSEGAGLGLAIVRAIAEAHRGQLTLANRPGAGATFTIVVPVDQPQVTPA